MTNVSCCLPVQPVSSNKTFGAVFDLILIETLNWEVFNREELISYFDPFTLHKFSAVFCIKLFNYFSIFIVSESRHFRFRLLRILANLTFWILSQSANKILTRLKINILGFSSVLDIICAIKLALLVPLDQCRKIQRYLRLKRIKFH